MIGAIIIGAGVLLGAPASGAQEQPPDIRMLMNLDLFAPHSPNKPAGNVSGGQGSGSDDDSMLEQMRTLRAMGYLGDKFAPADRGLEATDGATPLPELPNPGVQQ